MIDNDMKAGVERPRRTLEDRLYSFVGGEWCGNVTPPNDHRSFYFGPPGTDERPMFVASQIDDAGTLWLGYRDEWSLHMSMRESRRLAWWLLRGWALEWFGLRRRLWYRLLRRKIDPGR